MSSRARATSLVHREGVGEVALGVGPAAKAGSVPQERAYEP